MKISWLLLALLWAGSGYAAVYKWTDADGMVHYGDRPPATGAQAVDLPEVSHFKARPLPGQGANKNLPKKSEFKGYDRLVISRPENEQTIRSNEGLVTVSLTLSPGLQGGHKLQLLLDGRVVAENVGSGVQLSGVTRGSHELMAQVVDEDGREWVRSSPVRFYLHKVSKLNKPGTEPIGTPPPADTGGDTGTGGGASDGGTATPASPYTPRFAPNYAP